MRVIVVGRDKRNSYSLRLLPASAGPRRVAVRYALPLVLRRHGDVVDEDFRRLGPRELQGMRSEAADPLSVD